MSRATTLSSTPVLFDHNTAYWVNDVDQLMLGDCYFLEAIAAIANTSSRIEDIFITDTYDTATGVFCANAYL